MSLLKVLSIVIVLLHIVCVAKLRKNNAACIPTGIIGLDEQTEFLSEFEQSLNEDGVKILRDQKECGLPLKRRRQKRVANGRNARPTEFPWMALLLYSEGNDELCAGTLIADQYVLTAAHCVADKEDTLIGVRLGIINIRAAVNSQQLYGIANVTYHESYGGFKAYDMALIKLDRKVIFSDTIRPICLPVHSAPTELYSPQDVHVTGWGLIGDTNKRPKVLQHAILNYVDDEICQSHYHLSYQPDSHICIEGKAKTATCRGDSGGPIFALMPYGESTKEYRFVMYGIISHGPLCGVDIDYPGIHSSLAQQMWWITSRIIERN